jgi:histone H3/H4
MAKKKAGKAGAKKTSSSREVLVVASKVKAYVKGKNMNTSGEAIQALSNRVYELIDEAAGRTSGNGRKTVKAHDL